MRLFLTEIKQLFFIAGLLIAVTNNALLFSSAVDDKYESLKAQRTRLDKTRELYQVYEDYRSLAIKNVEERTKSPNFSSEIYDGMFFTIEKIDCELKNYKTRQISIEGFFTNILKERLDYLEYLTDEIIDIGVKEAFSIDSPYKHIANDLQDTYAEHYQFLVRLILCAFENVNMDIIKSNKYNFDLLRASVSLHPLLRGETQDIGIPDLAGGRGAFGPNSKLSWNDENLNPVDIVIFRKHFINKSIPTIKKQYDKGSRHHSYLITPFKANTTNKKFPLPNIDDIKPKKLINIVIERKPVGVKKQERRVRFSLMEKLCDVFH